MNEWMNVMQPEFTESKSLLCTDTFYCVRIFSVTSDIFFSVWNNVISYCICYLPSQTHLPNPSFYSPSFTLWVCYLYILVMHEKVLHQIFVLNFLCSIWQWVHTTQNQWQNGPIFPLVPMGVLAPGSAHGWPSAQPPINASGISKKLKKT